MPIAKDKIRIASWRDVNMSYLLCLNELQNCNKYYICKE